MRSRTTETPEPETLLYSSDAPLGPYTGDLSGSTLSEPRRVPIHESYLPILKDSLRRREGESVTGEKTERTPDLFLYLE